MKVEQFKFITFYLKEKTKSILSLDS